MKISPATFALLSLLGALAGCASGTPDEAVADQNGAFSGGREAASPSKAAAVRSALRTCEPANATNSVASSRATAQCDLAALKTAASVDGVYPYAAELARYQEDSSGFCASAATLPLRALTPIFETGSANDDAACVALTTVVAAALTEVYGLTAEPRAKESVAMLDALGANGDASAADDVACAHARSQATLEGKSSSDVLASYDGCLRAALDARADDAPTDGRHQEGGYDPAPVKTALAKLEASTRTLCTAMMPADDATKRGECAAVGERLLLVLGAL